jgi:GrpB-like predicted nucleotidyltransferase (UPF0157 family)
MDKYRFREYDSRYRSLFAAEKKSLQNILGASARIQHVGSTSVPGLGGKGILDIAVGVPVGRVTAIKQKLVEFGYEFRETASTPQRLFFRRDYPDGRRLRRVHVHLTEYKGRDWDEMTSFREHLWNNPEAVEEYVKIKKKAVAKARGKGDVYRKEKEQFIESVLRITGPTQKS